MQKQILIDQLVSNLVETLNLSREKALELAMIQIEQDNLSQLYSQNNAFLEAMNQIKHLKDLLSKPENILGRDSTKHGEIAELIEVYIKSAKDILDRKSPTATFDNIGRTSPTDYLIDGFQVQSKFCNSLNNTLKESIRHMQTYGDFHKDGLYKIPADQFELLQKILNGESLDGVSQRTINSVLEKISDIEILSGRSISEVVDSSISTYNDVQTANANDTVDKHANDLVGENNIKKSGIEKETKEKEQNARHKNAPSLQGALKTSAYAAVIGGTITAGVKVYNKYKTQNKTLSDFSRDDWKDVGIDFTKGGIKGGISGFSIYEMSNYTNLSAPMAGAFISTSIGIASLANRYKNGEINAGDFAVEGQILCMDASFTALGGALGQAIIPIPVIGAMIGCMGTQILTSIGKTHLSEKDYQLWDKLNIQYLKFERDLDYKTQLKLEQINEYYENLGGLLKASKNSEINYKLKFNISIDIALVVGIDESEILKSKEEIDDYFLG